MTRAEWVEQVRRLADETAYLAADVRRRDTALELLGQVRDFGHRLPPGLAADIRRVVDDMVATRHEAHREPSCSPRPGTSSAGGSGQRPPAAPSTETRQAAQDGQSGSGGDAMDGVPAHQPTPQAGDVWDYYGHRLRVTALSESHVETVCLTCLPDEGSARWITRDLTGRGRLVERDGKPWPPAAEQEFAGDAVEPATDEQIERWEQVLARLDAERQTPPSNLRKLIARIKRDGGRT